MSLYITEKIIEKGDCEHHFWYLTRDSRFMLYIKRVYAHICHARWSEIVSVEARTGYVNITRYNALI